jgi:YfiH family protein
VNDWIIPDWPAPASVKAVATTRLGGFSEGPWHSLNLGTNSGDDPAAVARNRAWLAQHLPAEPRWLQQVHGTTVLRHPGNATRPGNPGNDAGPGEREAAPVRAAPESIPPKADAQWSNSKGAVCAVLTADCLPVLFCDREGTRVAAAHAGWRGLAAGVLENTVAAMGIPASDLMAWLGPAIGPMAYQVGDEVRAAFLRKESESGLQTAGAQTAAYAFKAQGERWLFDLYAMARYRLQKAGVGHISGGGFCTFSDSGRFFSYRRDGTTGRMASLVWLR